MFNKQLNNGSLKESKITNAFPLSLRDADDCFDKVTKGKKCEHWA